MYIRGGREDIDNSNELLGLNVVDVLYDLDFFKSDLNRIESSSLINKQNIFNVVSNIYIKNGAI